MFLQYSCMIRFLIYLYIYVLIVDALLSYFPQYQNKPWSRTIKKLANYTLEPVRKILPSDLPFDVSPIIVIILLNLLPKLW